MDSSTPAQSPQVLRMIDQALALLASPEGSLEYVSEGPSDLYGRTWTKTVGGVTITFHQRRVVYTLEVTPAGAEMWSARVTDIRQREIAREFIKHRKSAIQASRDAKFEAVNTQRAQAEEHRRAVAAAALNHLSSEASLTGHAAPQPVEPSRR